MTDQPNPYATSETAARPVSKGKTLILRGASLWLCVGCVVPLALIGLAVGDLGVVLRRYRMTTPQSLHQVE